MVRTQAVPSTSAFASAVLSTTMHRTRALCMTARPIKNCACSISPTCKHASVGAAAAVIGQIENDIIQQTRQPVQATQYYMGADLRPRVIMSTQSPTITWYVLYVQWFQIKRWLQLNVAKPEKRLHFQVQCHSENCGHVGGGHDNQLYNSHGVQSRKLG